MVFFETEVNKKLFIRMANFLSIEPTKRWVKDALACFVVEPSSYSVPPGLVGHYKDRVAELFSEDPAILEKFRQFGNPELKESNETF